MRLSGGLQLPGCASDGIEALHMSGIVTITVRVHARLHVPPARAQPRGMCSGWRQRHVAHQK